MGRKYGPIYKVSRQLQISLLENGKEFTKGKRRTTRPGLHAHKRRRKLSDYGIQLQEKQKIKFTYDLNEKQMKKNYFLAKKMPGIASHNFLAVLESRLDNIIYRMGFCPTRRAARQLVNHGHVLVNNCKVNIPSYKVAIGSTIQIKQKSKNIALIDESIKNNDSTLPFVEVDSEEKSGKFVRLPNRNEIQNDINIELIISYYNHLS